MNFCFSNAKNRIKKKTKKFKTAVPKILIPLIHIFFGIKFRIVRKLVRFHFRIHVRLEATCIPNKNLHKLWGRIEEGGILGKFREEEEIRATGRITSRLIEPKRRERERERERSR